MIVIKVVFERAHRGDAGGVFYFILYTGKCLVPEAGELNPDDDTQLVERAACGEAYSSFALKRK